MPSAYLTRIGEEFSTWFNIPALHLRFWLRKREWTATESVDFTQVDMLYREHIDPQSLQSYSRGSTEPLVGGNNPGWTRSQLLQSSLSIGGSQIVRTPTLQVWMTPLRSLKHCGRLPAAVPTSCGMRSGSFPWPWPQTGRRMRAAWLEETTMSLATRWIRDDPHGWVVWWNWLLANVLQVILWGAWEGGAQTKTIPKRFRFIIHTAPLFWALQSEWYIIQFQNRSNKY